MTKESAALRQFRDLLKGRLAESPQRILTHDEAVKISVALNTIIERIEDDRVSEPLTMVAKEMSKSG